MTERPNGKNYTFVKHGRNTLSVITQSLTGLASMMLSVSK